MSDAGCPQFTPWGVLACGFANFWENLTWRMSFFETVCMLNRYITTELCWSGMNYVPPVHKRYVEILTPSTSECDLIWTQGLSRGNQVQMGSLGWALILIQRGNLDTKIDTHQGKMMWRCIGRRWSCDWSAASLSQGMPRRGQEGASRRVFRERWPYWHLDFRLITSRTMREYTSAVLRYSVFFFFCTLYDSSRKLIQTVLKIKACAFLRQKKQGAFDLKKVWLT